MLVVKGILIALSINNWNNHRKGNLKKNNLLRALEIEFAKNLTQLDTILKYDNAVVKSSFEFLNLNYNDSILNDESYMGYLIKKQVGGIRLTHKMELYGLVFLQEKLILLKIKH
ncbi:DUF6090 family protein [Maribacter sp. CXY002]|uniref:DUF6090 family protein n=1 Tax=Maribacter luteocoastalis TaxID=3407671 RepID=UPI003B68452C